MKKVLVTSFIVIAFVFYSLFYKKPDQALTEQTTTHTTNSNVLDTSNGSTNLSPTPSSASKGIYTNGSYIGSVEDAFYGNIQVKATITNGKLTDVTFLQYPNDHHESVQINSRAMPILKREAIAAQSADVDGVSRATDTSQAFIQSLATALNKAK